MMSSIVRVAIFLVNHNILVIGSLPRLNDARIAFGVVEVLVSKITIILPAQQQESIRTCVLFYRAVNSFAGVATTSLASWVKKIWSNDTRLNQKTFQASMLEQEEV